MKYCSIFFTIFCLYATTGCRSTRKLQTAVNKKDTAVVKMTSKSVSDSSSAKIQAIEILSKLDSDKINFTTFSAKAKVDYEDHNGKQPDFNAFIRLKKDSVLWISISATFLGIEAFRLYITPDTLILMNKLEKTVEYHPFKYIETVAQIPMDFNLLQNILIGNPVYVGDSIVSFRQTANQILVGTVGVFFKNLITLSSHDDHLQRIKLDDLDLSKNRTASLLYDDYQKQNNFDFSTNRQINVSEKTKVEVSILFKQYEFNNELSFPFNIPKNYKTK
ncbi:MAG: DUF4292 domain-containing protein [Ginsengibacter sp.]